MNRPPPPPPARPRTAPAHEAARTDADQSDGVQADVLGADDAQAVLPGKRTDAGRNTSYGDRHHRPGPGRPDDNRRRSGDGVDEIGDAQ